MYSLELAREVKTEIKFGKGSKCMSKIMTISKIALVILFFANGAANAKSASEAAKEYYTLLKQKNYRAVAGYYDPDALREFRQMMSFEHELPAEQRKAYFHTFFSPAQTDESVSKLSNSEYYASFLRGVLTSERFRDAVKVDNLEILGEVMEGKDIAHVVVRNRLSVGGNDIESIEVMTFKNNGSDWKVQMSGKLRGIALTLRWQLTHQQ